LGVSVVIALMTIITGSGQVGHLWSGQCAIDLNVDGIQALCPWHSSQVQRELLCFMIRIGGIVIIIRMTSGTSVGCIIVVTVMTGRTVVRNSTRVPRSS
jgi:hypothetical protein